MSIKDRGFASMTVSRHREIASKGGKAAHQKGTAHEWDSEQARAAGRKSRESRTRNEAAARARDETDAATTVKSLSEILAGAPPGLFRPIAPAGEQIIHVHGKCFVPAN